MANFKTHISGGLILGTTIGLCSGVFNLTNDNNLMAGLIAISAIIGSIAPDVDSDSSIPFNLAMTLLSIYFGGATFVFLLSIVSGDWLIVIGGSLATMLFVWFVIGAIFKKCTRHRGMVHSVPSALLGSLIVYLLIGRFGNLSDWSSFLLGISFGLGFILHLVLDELYATINFNGLRFSPKKSMGSALKLSSINHSANFIVYSAIIIIIGMHYSQLIQLSKQMLLVVG